MKIIFLDVDGVLNSLELVYLRDADSGNHPLHDIDDRNVKFLNLVVQESGAKIVISSSWRKLYRLEEIAAMLKEKGLVGDDVVIDRTISGSGYRGEEIQEWLDRHPEVSHYVILDDDSDMLPSQVKHFVKTPRLSGLGLPHVMRAAQILECHELVKDMASAGVEPDGYVRRRDLHVPVSTRNKE